MLHDPIARCQKKSLNHRAVFNGESAHQPAAAVHLPTVGIWPTVGTAEVRVTLRGNLAPSFKRPRKVKTCALVVFDLQSQIPQLTEAFTYMVDEKAPGMQGHAHPSSLSPYGPSATPC